MPYEDMQLSSSAPDLVNTAAFFRQTLRRLFTQRPEEVLEELLQNSQRAQASRIDFRFPEPTLCVVSDNGGGLEGQAALYTLLRVCDSAYDDPLVAVHQSPMGMGLYALFALDGVEEVEIRSNGIEFALDVARWFDDEQYRKRWFERATEQANYIGPRGFELRVLADADLIGSFRSLLLGEKHNAYGQEILSPARGYTGLLEVLVDGVPLDTALPDEITLVSHADIEDVYESNCIRIKRHRDLHRCDGTLYCNWYGQLITEHVHLPWDAYLEVRTGNPVNPQAPTRRHIIADQALAALKTWIETRLFTHVCAMASPTADHVALLYRLNRQRARQECPFALVQRWLPLPGNKKEIESADDVSTAYRAQKRVVRKMEHLLLLEDTVTVLLPGSHALQSLDVKQDPEQADTLVPVEFAYGLESFILATGLEAYRPVEGVDATHSLWWRPGANADGYHTTELGTYGIGEDMNEPLVWYPLTAGNVYVCDEVTSWEFDEVEMLIGVKRTEEMVPFLQRYGCVFFTPDDDYPERSEEVYSEQISEFARTYLQDAIDNATPLYELPGEIGGFFEEKGVQVTSLDFLYDEQGHRLQRICAHRQDGSSKVLTVYSHSQP